MMDHVLRQKVECQGRKFFVLYKSSFAHELLVTPTVSVQIAIAGSCDWETK